MKFICDGDSKTIDSNRDLSYTLINNVTGERYVLCKTCGRQIIGQKEKQINTLLREINDKHFKNRDGK
jgi:hypothetical protein